MIHHAPCDLKQYFTMHHEVNCSIYFIAGSVVSVSIYYFIVSNLEDNIILKDIGRDDKPVNIQSIAIMVLLLLKESRQYHFLYRVR